MKGTVALFVMVALVVMAVAGNRDVSDADRNGSVIELGDMNNAGRQDSSILSAGVLVELVRLMGSWSVQITTFDEPFEVEQITATEVAPPGVSEVQTDTFQISGDGTASRSWYETIDLPGTSAVEVTGSVRVGEQSYPFTLSAGP